MRRIITALSAFLLTLVAGLAIATPAQAAVFGCPDPATGATLKSNICLYDWINYNYDSGFWRRTNADVTAAPGDCINLGNYYWHDYNGTVGDAASSLVINSRYNTTFPAGLSIEFYEWINCNEASRSFVAFVAGDSGDLHVIPNLADITNRQGTIVQAEGTDFYNTIQSIRVGFGGS